MTEKSNTNNNPFISLNSYKDINKNIFYSREKQVEDAMSIIQSNSFLAITGDIASGKSSFINAGLIPRIKKGFNGINGNQWSIVNFRPGISPIENFCHALSSDGNLYISDKSKTTDYNDYLSTIREKNSIGLVEIYRNSEIFSKKNLLIVIDQLEDLYNFPDLFDYNESDDEDLLFDLVSKTLKFKDLGIYFIISIDTGNYKKLSSYDGLSKILSSSQFILHPINYVDLNEIIKKTFNAKNIQFDSEVMDQFNVLVTETDNSLNPNFQLFFKKLYDIYLSDLNHRSAYVNSEKIDQIGGVNQIIGIELENFYSSLDEKGKLILEKFFRSFINFDKKNIGHYYQEYSYIKNYTDVDDQYLTTLINNLDHKIEGILDVFNRNATNIKSKTNLNYDNDDIFKFNYVSNYNWDRLNEWIEDEKRNYLNFSENSYKAGLYPDKMPHLTNPLLTSASNWINKKFVDERWSQKYSFNYSRTVQYIRESIDKHNAKINYDKNLQIKREKIKKRNYTIAASLSVLFLGFFTYDYYNKYNTLERLQQQQQQIVDLKEMERDLRQRELIAQDQHRQDSIAIENQREEIEKRISLLEVKENTIIEQEKQVVSYRERADSTKLENEKFFQEIGQKSRIIQKNEDVILLIKEYSETNKKINSLLFKVDHTVSSDKKTINSFATQFIETFNRRNIILKEIDSIKNEVGQYNIVEKDKILDVEADDKNLRQLSLNLIAKLNGEDNYSDVKEVDYMQINNKPLNSLKISNEGRIATGGDSEILYRSKSVFDLNITPKNIVYDKMKFNSSISNIEFIDEDILAVVLKNGELWYANIATQDKVKLYPNEKRKVKILKRIVDEVGFNKKNQFEVIYIKDKNLGKLYSLIDNKLLSVDLANKKIENIEFEEFSNNEFIKKIGYNKSNNNIFFITSNLRLFKIDTNTNLFYNIDIDQINPNSLSRVEKINFFENNILFGTSDGWIYSYKESENKLFYKSRLNVHKSSIVDILSVNNQSSLYSSGTDGTLTITRNRILGIDEDQIEVQLGKNNYITDIAYSRKMGDNTIMTCDLKGNLIIWQFDLQNAVEYIKALAQN